MTPERLISSVNIHTGEEDWWVLLPPLPAEMSGGGQGNGKQPKPKIQGGQHRGKMDKQKYTPPPPRPK